MQISITKEFEVKIKGASKELGVDEQELVHRALLFYFDSIEKYLDFKNELLGWEILSSEALEKIESTR